MDIKLNPFGWEGQGRSHVNWAILKGKLPKGTRPVLTAAIDSTMHKVLWRQMPHNSSSNRVCWKHLSFRARPQILNFHWLGGFHSLNNLKIVHGGTSLEILLVAVPLGKGARSLNRQEHVILLESSRPENLFNSYLQPIPYPLRNLQWPTIIPKRFNSQDTLSGECGVRSQCIIFKNESDFYWNTYLVFLQIVFSFSDTASHRSSKYRTWEVTEMLYLLPLKCCIFFHGPCHSMCKYTDSSEEQHHQLSAWMVSFWRPGTYTKDRNHQ